jgi:hypothetical protein
MFADVNAECPLGEPMRCWREESGVSRARMVGFVIAGETRCLEGCLGATCPGDPP